ncbi:MAG: hypothetical protein KC620_06840 [Myxococcales bacterium]|nr:hypothetical protein [Myxococcales bacterium]
MAVAAPGGVGILLRINEKASRRRLAALLIGLGVAVGLLYAAGFQALAGQPDQRAFAWAIDLAALTIIVGVLLLKGPRGLRALAILAAVLGGLAFGSGEAYEYNRFPRPDTHHDAEVSVDALGGRLYDDHYLGFRPGARLGVRDASGYENDPLQGHRNHLILRAVHRAPQRLAHLGVTHFLRDKHPKMKNKLRLPKDDPGRAPGVHSVDGPIAPPVYVAGQVKIVPGRKALRTWLKTEPGSTAVVARDDATTELRALAERKPRPGVPGELLALQADHLTARVTGPGLAVFTETWHPDWQATVDGQPAQIHRANFDFRGVVIPSGTHTVQMDFRPAKRPWILAASAATLLLVILLLARRPRESAAS